MALSKPGRFLIKAEILGVGVSSPLSRGLGAGCVAMLRLGIKIKIWGPKPEP